MAAFAPFVDPNHFEAQGLNLHALLHEGKDATAIHYLVPNYQRPYVWDAERARTMVLKLWKTFSADRAGSTRYFIGAVVWAPATSAHIDRLLPEHLVIHRHDRQVFHKTVVDGQQRLTTIFLMLSALRTINAIHADVVTSLASIDANLTELLLCKLTDPSDTPVLLPRFSTRHDVLAAGDWIPFVSQEPFRPGDPANINRMATRYGQNFVAMRDVILRLLRENSVGAAGGGAHATQPTIIAQTLLKDFTTFLRRRLYLARIDTGSDRWALQIFNIINSPGVPIDTVSRAKFVICDVLTQHGLGGQGNAITASWDSRETELRNLGKDFVHNDFKDKEYAAVLVPFCHAFQSLTANFDMHRDKKLDLEVIIHDFVLENLDSGGAAALQLALDLGNAAVYSFQLACELLRLPGKLYRRRPVGDVEIALRHLVTIECAGEIGDAEALKRMWRPAAIAIMRAANVSIISDTSGRVSFTPNRDAAALLQKLEVIMLRYLGCKLAVATSGREAQLAVRLAGIVERANAVKRSGAVDPALSVALGGIIPEDSAAAEERLVLCRTVAMRMMPESGVAQLMTRHILDRLEHIISQDERNEGVPWTDFMYNRQWTLEHIFPQKVHKKNRTKFADADFFQIPQNQPHPPLRMLGNLVALEASINSHPSVSNHPFAIKKVEYITAQNGHPATQFQSVRQVAALSQWDGSAFRKRHVAMVVALFTDMGFPTQMVADMPSRILAFFEDGDEDLPADEYGDGDEDDGGGAATGVTGGAGALPRKHARA